MELSKEELSILEALIKLEKKIMACYKILLNDDKNEMTRKRLIGLIEHESMLIHLLNINEEKMSTVEMYLIDKCGIYLQNNLLTVIEPDLKDANSYYYRLMSRINYHYYDLLPFSLTLKNLKTEIIDLETSILARQLKLRIESLKSCGFGEIEELKKYLLYSLMDSCKVEKNYLQSTDRTIKIKNTLPLMTDALIRKYLIEASKVEGVEIGMTNELLDSAYNMIIGERMDENFDTLLQQFIEFTKIYGKDYLNKAEFWLYLSYMEMEISLLPKETRKQLYASLETMIEKQAKYHKDYLLSILKYSIAIIESTIIPNISYVSLYGMNKRFS